MTSIQHKTQNTGVISSTLSSMGQHQTGLMSNNKMYMKGSVERSKNQ